MFVHFFLNMSALWYAILRKIPLPAVCVSIFTVILVARPLPEIPQRYVCTHLPKGVPAPRACVCVCGGGLTSDRNRIACEFSSLSVTSELNVNNIQKYVSMFKNHEKELLSMRTTSRCITVRPKVLFLRSTAILTGN